MPGAVVAAQLAGGIALLTVGLCGTGAAAVASQRAAGAADAAALAASDAASGAVAGFPCDRAAQVAGSYGAAVTACALEGLVATVSVSVPFGVLAASATARAGPPGSA